MAGGPAHIDSPEVIRTLRNQYVEFDRQCRNALTDASADVKRTVQWLRDRQRVTMKQELRKRSEELHQAESAYKDARWSSSALGTSRAVDEKRALERAKRRKEEAERKAEAVRKWTHLLDQKAGKMMGPCHSLANLLNELTPRALARMDQMMDSLDEYFRSAPKG